MRRIVRVACLGVLVSGIGIEAPLAQTPAPPSFEVTSVKASSPNA